MKNTINKTLTKIGAAAASGGLVAAGMLIGVPTQANAAIVDAWDCRTYLTKIDHDSVRKDKWCTKRVANTLFPVYGRVKVSSVVVHGVYLT